jgi:hypothetical protein
MDGRRVLFFSKMNVEGKRNESSKALYSRACTV